MGAQAWYKHYHADFVHGVLGLGAAEIGAYIVILDLIYDRGGPIPDNSRWLGQILGAHARHVRGLIEHLIRAGKIARVDGKLYNQRADREQKDRQKASKRRAKGGKKEGFFFQSFNDQIEEKQILGEISPVLRARVPETRDQRRDKTPLKRVLSLSGQPEGGSQPNGARLNTPEELERRQRKVDEAKKRIFDA